MVDHLGGRRLYVGGLDMMVNQALHNTEMTELFAEFCPYVIELHPLYCKTFYLTDTPELRLAKESPHMRAKDLYRATITTASLTSLPENRQPTRRTH
jgi:hypothetical protein